MIKVEWDNAKNEKLKKDRDVCFEDVERAILDKQLIDILPHFNQDKYPNQNILIVLLSNYIHYVPYVKDDEKLFLKSIVPSRKYNKIYNLKD